MKKRRETQSSALSFMDCICCGFGAVLLLFILTAKAQILESQFEATQSSQAAETLQAAIEEAKEKQRALEREIETLDPQPDSTTSSLTQLAAEKERLAKAVEEQALALAALETETEIEKQPGALERPSADQNYLSGLSLRGPKAVILLESSGSMLGGNAAEALQIIQQGTSATADKWLRAKASVRAVIASIPRGTEVAVLSISDETIILTGTEENPYIDPYDNAALLALLERLDRLEARGGAHLANGLITATRLPQRPSSLLLIADGLPSAPAPAGGSLSETDRVRLFNQAITQRPNAPLNVILLPFEGDPSAAGLFWRLTGSTGGITLMPHPDWPPL